jgi:hypothetical protein
MMEYWNSGILGKNRFICLQTHHSIVPLFQYSISSDGFCLLKTFNLFVRVPYLF